ncbi:MAG: glutamine synthetase beta-grasp domain-containing protein, partial [Clostridiales bacterium]
MFQTVNDVQGYCQDNGIKMIDFKMIDINGRWRHITIPFQRLTNDTLIYGIGFDGSNYGYAQVEKSDMVFIPTLQTATIDPFLATPTLTMTGDVCVIEQPDNRPFDQYPRNVARRAIDYMNEQGIADQMIIGPEFEFHLFDQVNFEVQPNRVAYAVDTAQAIWNAG